MYACMYFGGFEGTKVIRNFVIGGDYRKFVLDNDKVANKCICNQICSPKFLTYGSAQINRVQRQIGIDICPDHRI